jgi:hypothetical protein
MRTQAPKGGCEGVNGDYYIGGQFLPSSEMTIKGAIKIQSKPRGKVQVENGVWVESRDGYLPIFPRIAGTIAILDRATGNMKLNNVNWDYMGCTAVEGQALIDAYNRGDRWLPVENN